MMSTTQNNLQNYFNPHTLICLPSVEDLSSNFDTIVVRLGYNQFLDAQNIKFIFEQNMNFGIVEKIEKVMNTRNAKVLNANTGNDFQIVYIIKFKQIFRNSESYMHVFYNLLNWGYNDICILFAENNPLGVNVRVFYDKMFNDGATIESVKMRGIIDRQMVQIKTDMRQNYEQFECSVESDINLLDEKSEVVRKELADSKSEIKELKDQIKWINKIFYQRLKELDTNLRDDFKDFTEGLPRIRRRGTRGRGGGRGRSIRGDSSTREEN